MAAHRPSTSRLTSASSSPSAITRITGSVPLARSSSRPEPARLASALAMAACTRLSASGEPPAKRTLRRRCGSGSNRRQASLAGHCRSASAASTCNAATRPSPVVE